MIEVTIIDYTMKVLAHDHYSSLYPRTTSCSSNPMTPEATSAFTKFMGLFGLATNALSFLLSFFGTSKILSTFGLKLTLRLFPILCFLTILIVRLFPSLHIVFASMMLLKANSYAINNPTKELLYQPTSTTVKYKAKSWIDIFGARGSKAFGSLITNSLSQVSADKLISQGSMVGMFVSLILYLNACYMGQKYEQYRMEGYVVGKLEEEGKVSYLELELAKNQNDDREEGTSCGVKWEKENVEKKSMELDRDSVSEDEMESRNGLEDDNEEEDSNVKSDERSI